MTTPGSGRPLGSTALVWCLRTFLWLPVLAVVVGSAGTLLLLEPSDYQATSLVVTRQTQPEEKILPGYGAAVFYGGAVARQVAPQFGVANPSTLVPDRLDVVVPQDSVVFTVIGKDPDPNVAARLADAGATAFVVELNRGGPAIGTFSVQTRATVPSAPILDYPPVLGAVVGGLLGLVLGLGAVALVAALRRPVVAAEDVARTVGTGLLGTLTLPRSVSQFVHPRDVPGGSAVARRLSAVAHPRFLLVSDPRDAARRQQTLVALGVALSGLRPTSLHGDPRLNEEMRALLGDSAHPAPNESGHFVLIDQDEPVELLQLPGGTLVVIVAQKGVPAARLRATTAAFPQPELIGVVLVDTPRRRRSQHLPAPAAPAAVERASR